MYYADDGISFLDLGFENDVNMYGTQAISHKLRSLSLFENDVNMYGTQATSVVLAGATRFENDVNMYGTQAQSQTLVLMARLRMM